TGLFVNPPYEFSPEDNLAYRDYILLHEAAAQFIALHSPNSRVLTTWPGSEELSRPYLGYVTKPVSVLAIDNFSLDPIMTVAQRRPDFDLAYLFSTKYEPPDRIVDWAWWNRFKVRFFDYHRELPP